MTWFLGSLFWALLALAQILAGFLFRAVMSVLWLFWPVVLMAALLMVSAQPCEAGWFSWLWGSNTRQLERSLDVAKEAARVANEASQAQAQQAVAQAEQNARLAETLGQLSSERSNLAAHLHALTELGLKDSQWCAHTTTTLVAPDSLGWWTLSISNGGTTWGAEWIEGRWRRGDGGLPGRRRAG